MSQVNQDPILQEEKNTLYRLCVSLARQLRLQLGYNNKKCPLCGSEHVHPKQIQEVANRAFIGQ